MSCVQHTERLDSLDMYRLGTAMATCNSNFGKSDNDIVTVVVYVRVADSNAS